MSKRPAKPRGHRNRGLDSDLPSDLDAEDRKSIKERKSPPARVVHEVIRQQGIEELERPTLSLLWSGYAAGVTIFLSLISQAVLMTKLPDTPYRPAIAAIGYSVGFVMTILGRLQLFTESTITAVLPVATDPNGANLARTLRLWGLVLVANFAGTFTVALLLPQAHLVNDAQLAAMIAISREALDVTAGEAFTRGIPAGFILATIAWLLPSARSQEVLIVTILTYLIALAGFAHVIAGSAEAWLLLTTGNESFGQVFAGFILPALGGNIVGGTFLFAVLAHAQVRAEL